VYISQRKARCLQESRSRLKGHCSYAIVVLAANVTMTAKHANRSHARLLRVIRTFELIPVFVSSKDTHHVLYVGRERQIHRYAGRYRVEQHAGGNFHLARRYEERPVGRIGQSSFIEHLAKDSGGSVATAKGCEDNRDCAGVFA